VTAEVDLAAGRDAVVIIPGIMGSELVEAETGRTLWGLADMGWYASAWTTGGSLTRLAVTRQPCSEESEQPRKGLTIISHRATLPTTRSAARSSDTRTHRLALLDSLNDCTMPISSWHNDVRRVVTKFEYRPCVAAAWGIVDRDHLLAQSWHAAHPAVLQ
jgi:hypothetical protein